MTHRTLLFADQGRGIYLSKPDAAGTVFYCVWPTRDVWRARTTDPGGNVIDLGVHHTLDGAMIACNRYDGARRPE